MIIELLWCRMLNDVIDDHALVFEVGTIHLMSIYKVNLEVFQSEWCILFDSIDRDVVQISNLSERS